jgi:hypothetical protein
VRAHAFRLDLLAEWDPKGGVFLRRLPSVSVQALPQAQMNGGVAFTDRPGGG